MDADDDDFLKAQFYKAVDTKSSNFKALSPDTEVIEQEQVIETLRKPSMHHHGQIMLSKFPKSLNIM